MRKISRRQFDAYCYARQPLIRVIAEEVAWFEAYDRKILATVSLDKTDGDYGFIILGRDSRRLFRCIEVGREFYETPQLAELELFKQAEKYKDDGQELYPQGDEVEAPHEIFVPVVVDADLHPYFYALISEDRFEGARNLIREIVYSFKDPDGHYIKEFQTNGFEARLWELYLYMYLYDEGFEFIHGNPSPDFHTSFYGKEVMIEAVTVNPSQDPKRPDPAPPTCEAEVAALQDNYLPIKYGSPLYSKLNKRYWEKPHVAGKPLVFAIHDYHMPGSMTWSRTALSEYLYGLKASVKKNAEGKDEANVEAIVEHEWLGKVIPSNFFAQPDAEHVSAVLFSNDATITKFNRMGKLAGLGSADIRMIRNCMLFDPNPDSLTPISVAVDVDDEDYEESWSDSIMMYHNPNALHPIDPQWFPSISHIWIDPETGEFRGFHQPYDVLCSTTMVFVPDRNNEHFPDSPPTT